MNHQHIRDILTISAPHMSGAYFLIMRLNKINMATQSSSLVAILNKTSLNRLDTNMASIRPFAEVTKPN